ncbi:MAG: DUF4147 domain-containing protein [Candidatus Thermoplasmatota archaeon]|nr:DUF4147 domain-containing protein [Candidatus Thermoplasmatota archaeon]
MLFKNYDELVLNGATPLLKQKRRDVLAMLSSALEAVHPSRVVRDVFVGSQMVFPSEVIDLSSFDRLYLIGFGKASVGMAEAVCDAVPIKRGVVITNDQRAALSHSYITVVHGGHPLPDEHSVDGAERILEVLHQATEKDCVIAVISGGGSSLFCKPRVPLADLQKTIDLLLRSGATIDEINCIRKHLSLVKGGLLVKHTKAVMISLIISDVVHDPVSSIASGPTSPDPTSFSTARDVLHRYHLWGVVPSSVRALIDRGLTGAVPETLKEGDPAFDTVFHFIIVNNERACQGALQKAKELGYEAQILTTSLTGEARFLGNYLVERVRQSPLSRTTAFISGGEPTVTIHGTGVGGRNQELVLGCVKEIAGSDMVIASFATDGIDGTSRAAGALADGNTLARAMQQNLHPSRLLKENDSYRFFHSLGDMLQTGPTGTNVMDIQILLP